jgi:hypothetical protein
VSELDRGTEVCMAGLATETVDLTADVTAERMDAGGRPWTIGESLVAIYGVCGRTWTALDDFSRTVNP